jgi:hypothetical protein
MQFHVDPNKTSLLNLRREPGTGGTILVALPQGTGVEKLWADDTAPGWWQVRARLLGQLVEGDLHSRFIAPGLLEEPDVSTPVDRCFIPILGASPTQT